MKFKNVEEDVREILEYNTAARYDDMTLYSEYVYNKTQGLGLGKNWLLEVFTNWRFRHDHNIASYGSVSRARRKLQSESVIYQPPKHYIEARKKAEKEYYDHYRKKAKA